MKMNKVRATRIGGIVLVLAIAALSWFFLLSPRLSKAAEVSAQAAQVQTANLSLRNQYNQSLAQAQEAPQAAAEAQKLFATMPQQAELPQVLEQVSGAAEAAGIKTGDIRTINASIPAAVAPSVGDVSGIKLASMALTVTADAGRDKALTFLDNLQALDRAMLIKSSELQQAIGITGQTEAENVQVVGSMFVLQSTLPDLVAQVDALLAAAGQTPAATTDGTSPEPAG